MGHIICIEGIDASGKATQATRLARKLGAAQHSFPRYDTPLGCLIRTHLRKQWEARWLGWSPNEGAVRDVMTRGDTGCPTGAALDALTFQALQLADKVAAAPGLLADAAKGHVVLDRYWPSACVYGEASGLDADYLVELHTALPQASLHVLLDVGPETSAVRRPERRDAFEADSDFLREVAAGYRKLWASMGEEQPEKWVVVDGSRSVEDVSVDVDAALASLSIYSGGQPGHG